MLASRASRASPVLRDQTVRVLPVTKVRLAPKAILGPLEQSEQLEPRVPLEPRATQALRALQDLLDPLVPSGPRDSREPPGRSGLPEPRAIQEQPELPDPRATRDRLVRRDLPVPLAPLG
jgi:hypothetical protein